MMSFSELADSLKNNKRAQLILIAALSVLILLIYFLPQSSNNQEHSGINNTTAVEKSKEQRLEEVLSNIKDAGKVRVMITYKSGSELVCAGSTKTETNTVSERYENGTVKETETVIESSTPVTVGSGSAEEPLVTVEREAEIKGVIVVAQGANKLNVRLDLQKAVETVLQVSPSQVEIFVMN